MWKKIVPEDGNDGGSEFVLVKNVYGLNGSQYPRICVGVYPDVFTTSEKRVRISCSEKSDPESWWHDQGIPKELIGDLKEMLDLAVGK